MIRRCHNFHTLLNAQSHIKSYQKTNLFVYSCDLSLRLIEIRNGAEVSCGHASSNVTESLKVSQKKDRLIMWQYRVSWQYNHKQHSIVVLFTRTFTLLGVLGPVRRNEIFSFFSPSQPCIFPPSTFSTSFQLLMNFNWIWLLPMKTKWSDIMAISTSF